MKRLLSHYSPFSALLPPQELRAQYEERQADLAKELVQIASGYSQPMERLNDVIALLDTIVSLATVAASAPVEYVRPTVLPQGTIYACSDQLLIAFHYSSCPSGFSFAIS